VIAGPADAAQTNAGLSRLWTAVQSEPVKGWLLAAALVAAVFLAYQPAWNGGFLWDDDTHLLNNPVLQPGGLLQTWLPGDYINYWPLTFTVYRIEHELWGLDTLGYHLVNIALHAAAALLVWRVLLRLRIPGALLAAAIFALHPVNVESVAWISQLKNVLSLTLALLAVLFYLQHERDGGRWRFALSLGLFLLSTLAKGMVLTLPVVLLACAWWQRGFLGRRDLLRVLPFFLIAALMVAIEVTRQHAGSGDVVIRSDGLLGRAAVAGCAVWFYFWKALWPGNLMFIYPRWTIADRDICAYLPGLLLVAILALAWWRRRSWGRCVVMLIVCYVALLLPALGFVDIIFMQYSLVADHWQYAALIVPCAALAAALAKLARHTPLSRFGREAGGEGLLAYSLSLALLAILASFTLLQSRMYADVETLYRTAVAQNPACWLTQNNLGVLLTNQGKFLESGGSIDEAMSHCREAVAHCREALKLKPDDADTKINLGIALACLGQTDDAIAHFQDVLKTKPDLAAARYNLAMALAKQGRFEEAIRQYQDVLKITPDDFAALNQLGWLRATCPQAAVRNAAEAVDLAQRAYTLSKGHDPTIVDTLAAAYAEAGHFSHAVQAARSALDLAMRQENAVLAERIKTRLQLYRRGLPYRQPSAAPPKSRKKTTSTVTSASCAPRWA
jgi:protein O-mannosyl-transferase